MLENIIMAVSREIDNITGRRFFVNTNDETRYYATTNGNRVLTDDIVSITTLKTDDDYDGVYETTWAATDYNLMPYNASLDGIPYNMIQTTPLGNYDFPCARRRWTYKAIQIVGKFGWSAAPYPVQEACNIQTIRLFRRKDAPFGVAGGAEMGQAIVIPKLDPDVKLLLQAYERMV